jgi:hypothetical protein
LTALTPPAPPLSLQPALIISSSSSTSPRKTTRALAHASATAAQAARLSFPIKAKGLSLKLQDVSSIVPGPDKATGYTNFFSSCRNRFAPPRPSCDGLTFGDSISAICAPDCSSHCVSLSFGIQQCLPSVLWSSRRLLLHAGRRQLEVLIGLVGRADQGEPEDRVLWVEAVVVRGFCAA